MSELHETTGTFRFSPPLGRGGSTVRRDGVTTEWWLILECDREIGSYLRFLFAKERHGVEELNEPLWGTHVSVIRDEKPPELAAWKAPEGDAVKLFYSQEVEIHSGYAAVPVVCEDVLDYREKLGLPREPKFPLHMTIGNLKPRG
jgi:hypothetical protein